MSDSLSSTAQIRPLGACARCRRLRMKCQTEEGTNICRRCRVGKHECIRGQLDERNYRSIVSNNETTQIELKPLSLPPEHPVGNISEFITNEYESEARALGIFDTLDSHLPPTDERNRASEVFWDPTAGVTIDETPLDEGLKGVGYPADYVEGQYDFAELHRRLHIYVEGQENNQSSSVPSDSPPKADQTAIDVQNGDDNGSHDTSAPPRKRRRLGGESIKTLDWTQFVEPDHKRYIGGGGFGDVHEGKWKIPSQLDSMQPPPPRIVIKRFRISGGNKKAIDDKLKTIFREIAVWHVLKHEHIVPFVGVYHVPGDVPCLISEWMFNGSVSSYIRESPSVCLRKMAIGVARGLQYLHNSSPRIVHGDMKADNVLINSRGQPCLCDFGLSRILIDNTLWNTSAKQASGTMRWMAPELIHGSQRTVTAESDVYAYGMTLYEIVTGLVPFHELESDAQVLLAILTKHERPRNDAIYKREDTWKLMESCWAEDPLARLTTSQILDSLQSHICKEHSTMCMFRTLIAP